jgi:hypothetical protein
MLRLAALHFYLASLTLPLFSLFRFVLPQGDVDYRVHVMNIVIVVSISACDSNYPDFPPV